MPGKVIRFPDRPAPDPRDDRALVEVHRCDQREALVVKGLFESEGIPVVVRSRIAHSVHPFTVGAQGEVTLAVELPEGTSLTKTDAVVARLGRELKGLAGVRTVFANRRGRRAIRPANTSTADAKNLASSAINSAAP